MPESKTEKEAEQKRTFYVGVPLLSERKKRKFWKLPRSIVLHLISWKRVLWPLLLIPRGWESEYMALPLWWKGAWSMGLEMPVTITQEL